MDNMRTEDNKRAIEAAVCKEAKERFLTEEQSHILHLTARILKRTVTDSDDEYLTALMAVSEAVDSYREDRGNFWSYAALVIKSRILDEYRQSASHKAEISVGPEIFGEALDDEDGFQISLRREVESKTAVYIDNGLRDEIEALTEELKGYDVDLFDLPGAAPKAEKTRSKCKELIDAFFTPPPLIDELRRTKNLPVRELLARCHVSRKLIDRHRKYLLAAALVKAGDYNGIGEYLR